MARAVRRVERADNGRYRIEWADNDDIEAGDRVLVYPDEQVPVDGTLVAPRNPETLTEAGGPPLFAGDAGTPAESTIAIEDDAGERRPAVVGEGVAAGETVRRGAVVVEVGRGGFPWLPVGAGPLAGLSQLSGKSLARFALVVFVVAVALAGTGLGANNPFDGIARENSERISEWLGSDGRINGQGVTPKPPTVEVTPPEPNSADDGPTGSGPAGGSDNLAATPTPADTQTNTPTETSTPTATPNETATATPNGTATSNETVTPNGTATATPMETATNGNAGGGGNGRSGSEVSVTATIDLTAGDPGEIQNDEGTVGNISGPISGTLSWTGRVDSVVLVVQSWVPEQGWQEVRRLTVSGSSPVSLADPLGDVVYASGGRADAFENANNGTTKRSTGLLSVTAVLFADGGEVDRTQVTNEYNVTVTNVGAQTPPLDLELGDGTGQTTLIDFGDGDGDVGDDSGVVVPGSNGVNRVTLANDGSRDGVLELASVNYTSYENGLTGPEAEVDDTGGDPGAGAGELHEALEIRATLEFENGSSRYVIGNKTSYRTIASLENTTIALSELDAGESVDLVVEYRVPESTGNEIQSDTIVVDFRFRLVDAAAGQERLGAEVTAGTAEG